MVCLETSFLIDLLRGDRETRDKFEKFFNEQDVITIAAPSIMEIISGASFNKKTDEKEKILTIISSLAILSLDKESAILAGEIDSHLIMEGETVPITDIMIAAIAKHNDETLITRDVKHFSRIPGLKVQTY